VKREKLKRDSEVTLFGREERLKTCGSHLKSFLSKTEKKWKGAEIFLYVSNYTLISITLI